MEDELFAGFQRRVIDERRNDVQQRQALDHVPGVRALDTWYSERGGPLGIGGAWATKLRGHALAGGHFFPEQNPTETGDALRAFFLGQVR